MTGYSQGQFGKGGFGTSGFTSTVGDSLIERLPPLLPAHGEGGDFTGWIEAHQSEVDSFRVSIQSVQKSLQIAYAEGQSLDLIGADFGRLGRRRGRSDSEYRQYLQSLVRAFGGRGTAQDVRFTVSASLVVPESTVDVIEDFTANSYDLHIHEWSDHRCDTVAEMADLADPAAVPLEQQVYIQSGEMNGQGVATDVQISPASGLSSGSMGTLSSGSWNLSE